MPPVAPPFAVTVEKILAEPGPPTVKGIEELIVKLSLESIRVPAFPPSPDS
jgi:hypothetical protein